MIADTQCPPLWPLCDAFPRSVSFSDGTQHVHQGPSILPNWLLCGLHDLCAMLSPLSVFLASDNRDLLSVIENCIAGE